MQINLHSVIFLLYHSKSKLLLHCSPNQVIFFIILIFLKFPIILMDIKRRQKKKKVSHKCYWKDLWKLHGVSLYFQDKTWNNVFLQYKRKYYMDFNINFYLSLKLYFLTEFFSFLGFFLKNNFSFYTNQSDKATKMHGFNEDERNWTNVIIEKRKEKEDRIQ